MPVNLSASPRAPTPTPQLSSAEIKSLRKSLQLVPFAQLLGLKFVRVERGAVTIRLGVRDDLKQNNGTLHGGALATLLDTASAFAVITLLSDGETTATVNLSVSYLQSIKRGQVIAAARVLKAGRRLLSVAVDVKDTQGRLLATALSTFVRNQNNS